MPDSVTSLKTSEKLGMCSDGDGHSGAPGRVLFRVQGIRERQVIFQGKNAPFPRAGTDFIPQAGSQPPPTHAAREPRDRADGPMTGWLITSQNLKNMPPLTW